MTLVATESCTLKQSAENWAAPPVVTGLGAQKVKAGGSPVLCDTLSVQCPAWLPGGGDTSPGVAAGPFVFTAMSQKVKTGGLLVLVEGDKSAPVVITWANSPPNVPTRVASVTLKIDDPGQDKVSAA